MRRKSPEHEKKRDRETVSLQPRPGKGTTYFIFLYFEEFLRGTKGNIMLPPLLVVILCCFISTNGQILNPPSFNLAEGRNVSLKSPKEYKVLMLLVRYRQAQHAERESSNVNSTANL